MPILIPDRTLRIAICSPDATVKSLLTAALKAEYIVLTDDRASLKTRLQDPSAVDVLVLDFDSNGSSLDEQLAFYEEIAGATAVPIIVMTDDLRRSTAMEFLQRRAFDCIRKPPSLVDFKVIVGRAHEHALMKAELARARGPVQSGSCDRLIGSSGPAEAVYDLVRRVANVGASVLITGESGTGKELVARAIHNLGSRADQPFIAVSCGAIPEALIESELFGHERGAFTGSTGSRAGYFEQAGGGTLFLDEIGELSPNTQIKLLRVLQQREFSRLGSTRILPLNARVLFATHRNLADMVDTGAFRRDLFYRVNVINIPVPPLRDRADDIPMLAQHFLRKYAADYGKAIDDIRPNAMALLVDYDWPGNIRELENVIQRAVIHADGDSICRADLPNQLQPQRPVLVSAAESADFEGLIRQYKLDLISRTVEDCNGNKTLAAHKLGLSRVYVHRLLRDGSGLDSVALAESA